MKRLGIIALALALTASACSKSANNSISSNTSNNNISTTSTSNSSSTSSNSSSSSSPTDNSSPSAAYKAAYEAAKRKDIASLKNIISQKDLHDLDEEARDEGKTTDDLLKDSIGDPEDPLPATLEMRNEQISGDKATLEFKNSKGKWEKINLVKEDGSWKLDIGDNDDTNSPAPGEDGGKGEGNSDDHSGH
jgi:hypothetical protein